MFNSVRFVLIYEESSRVALYLYIINKLSYRLKIFRYHITIKNKVSSKEIKTIAAQFKLKLEITEIIFFILRK
jgi:hypothetical protein